MTTRYVDNTVGASGTGLSWAQAYKTLAEAIAVATSGDEIWVSHTSAEAVGVSTTYSVPNGVTLMSVNKSTDVYAAGAEINCGSVSGGEVAAQAAGGGKALICGIVFKSTTASSTTTPNFGGSATDDTNTTFEDCTFWLPGTGASSRIFLGSTAITSIVKTIIRTRNCTFKWGATAQGVSVHTGLWESFGDTFVGAGGSTPTALLRAVTDGTDINIYASDLSAFTAEGSLSGGQASIMVLKLFNCTLGTLTPFLTTAPAEGPQYYAYDCHTGDSHFFSIHYNALGSTIVSTSIALNAGLTAAAKYDGLNIQSWKIVTTANASRVAPYISPWISRYWDGTATITPYLEILRDLSATAYTDAEVWSEWLYKGTTAKTKGVMVNDRNINRVTAADQTASALSANAWTGANATNWQGILAPTSGFAPQEIGVLSVRVLVAAASATVYVNPKILT